MDTITAFGSPLTWFVADLLALLLWSACLVHAGHSKNAVQRLVFLFGFTMYAGVFEHIGVHSGRYFYDHHRIAMVEEVPLGVMMMEADIVYSVYTLIVLLKLPVAARVFAAGFLASFQDLTIDPTAVQDQYNLGSGLFGQWTWVRHYNGAYFGIPFFNFSGWFYFAATFVAAYEILIRLPYLCGKDEVKGTAYLTPFALVLLAVGMLVPSGSVMVDLGHYGVRWAELTMMLVNYAIGLFCLIKFIKVDGRFDLSRNWAVVLAIPLALHIYDIAVAFARGITAVYLPVLLFTMIHVVAFVLLLRALERHDSPIARKRPIAVAEASDSR